MPARTRKMKTKLHGGPLAHLRSGLRTANEDAQFPEEDGGECGFDQLWTQGEMGQGESWAS